MPAAMCIYRESSLSKVDIKLRRILLLPILIFDYGCVCKVEQQSSYTRNTQMDAMMMRMAQMNMGAPPPRRGMACTHRTVTPVEFEDSFAFTCNGCREMGYGFCFQCTNGCDYHLHEECLTASLVAHHHFFEQRPFSLQREQFPNSGYLCTACGMSVDGWKYYHTLPSGNSIFLHPCCMKMPHCIETDDGDKLFLKKQLVSLECKVCEHTTLGGPINGWAYMSADQELVCHVKCMKDMMYEDWTMYGQMEDLEGPWWLSPYADLEDLEGPRWLSPYATSPQPQPQQVVYHYHHHTHYYAGHQQNSVVTTTTRPRPALPSQQQQQYQSSSVVPYVAPSSSRPPRPTAPHGQQNNLALTTANRPTGRKRRIFWKLTKATAKLLFSFAAQEPTTAITAVYDLLN